MMLSATNYALQYQWKINGLIDLIVVSYHYCRNKYKPHTQNPLLARQKFIHLCY